jgi:predicted CoA-binding protein
MVFVNPPDEVIREVLATPRTIAVVGCSPDPGRDSNHVARVLIERGHRVVPVNPRAGEILGRRCFPSLRDVPEPIEMVDVFRRSSEVAAIARDAVAIGARILWLQLGVIDAGAAEEAAGAGLTVVMDRCPVIEYRRLFP